MRKGAIALLGLVWMSCGTTLEYQKPVHFIKKDALTHFGTHEIFMLEVCGVALNFDSYFRHESEIEVSSKVNEDHIVSVHEYVADRNELGDVIREIRFRNGESDTRILFINIGEDTIARGVTFFVTVLAQGGSVLRQCRQDVRLE